MSSSTPECGIPRVGSTTNSSNNLCSPLRWDDLRAGSPVSTDEANRDISSLETSSAGSTSTAPSSKGGSSTSRKAKIVASILGSLTALFGVALIVALSVTNPGTFLATLLLPAQGLLGVIPGLTLQIAVTGLILGGGLGAAAIAGFSLHKDASMQHLNDAGMEPF